MKPQILSTLTPTGSHTACIVNANSVCVRTEDGKTRLHYMTAVNIGPCHVGQVELSHPDPEGNMRILSPAPCVLAVRPKGMKTVDLAARGVDPRAAAVMLGIAAAVQNVQVPFNGELTWTFGEPITRSSSQAIIPAPTIEKLIAVWKWSFWEKNGMSGSSRHEDMTRLGYRGTAANLRNMMSKLGLVSTKDS